jgi:glycosyltransferase involved in cell wall biosynthesis
VRFLLVNNHCISDPTAGVTHSLRTIVEWLAEAGHACHVLTTARFEGRVSFTIDDHLRQQGADRPAAVRKASRGKGRTSGTATAHYHVGVVPVTLLLTRHNDETRPDRAETAAFLDRFEGLLSTYAPDQVIGCNGHPMIFGAMKEARRRGITTAFAVRGFGYDLPRYFDDVDHVFTCSQYLTDHYRDQLGLVSTPLEPPIDWSTVVAPEDARAFVTFVHPAPHKGLLLFARLADMLGARRPDIPVLVVQSAHSAGALNAIPGIDFAKYPQIMAAPHVSTPAEYFALTRLLLVPSVWPEPFGRVAAEAMINGIPPLVGNRGALPDVIGGDYADGGGGRVLPIPDWMAHDTARLPTEQEIQPWFDAVCQLWDDDALYQSVAARARARAEARYREDLSRKRHVDYFTSLRPGAHPIRAMTRTPSDATP